VSRLGETHQCAGFYDYSRRRPADSSWLAVVPRLPSGLKCYGKLPVCLIMENTLE
jgi:hypothetical protein